MGLFWWIFPGSKTFALSFFFPKNVKELYIKFSSENQPITYKYPWTSRKVGVAWGKWQCAAAEGKCSLPATCMCTRVLTAAHTRTRFSLTVAPSPFPPDAWNAVAEQRIRSSVTVSIYITPADGHGAARPKVLWVRARALVSRLLVQILSAFPLSQSFIHFPKPRGNDTAVVMKDRPLLASSVLLTV